MPVVLRVRKKDGGRGRGARRKYGGRLDARNEEERMGEQDNREEEMAEEPEEIFYADAADFAIELLKGDRKGKDGDNVMVSPLSVMTAMAITANGAGGIRWIRCFPFLGKTRMWMGGTGT